MLQGEKLTSNDKEFLDQLLSKNGVRNNCSECGTIDAFEFLPYSQKTSPIVNKEELAKNPKAKAGIAVVTQTCKKCGYIRSFSVNQIMASI